MLGLAGARIANIKDSAIEITLDGEFRASICLLNDYIAKLLIIRPSGLRLDRTWSLSPELGGVSEPDPIDGRSRMDLSGFPGSCIAVSEDEAAIQVRSGCIGVDINRTPFALTWLFCKSPGQPFETVFQDRQTQPYLYARKTARFIHALKRDPADLYYGFGEKTGNAGKNGRRLRMGAMDACGYDAETSDPLYKHIPFYLTVRPDRGGAAAGLFYDNLARAAFDLGQEIGAYHGPYRTFEAEDGDLDLYVIFGPAIHDAVSRFAELTGRTAFAPRWSLSYSGSAMPYTDASDASVLLSDFLDDVEEHQVPCRSFHLSSGYTLSGGKRYVFTWNRERIPDPRALAAQFARAGLRLIANIKPAMLTDHPLFSQVEAFQGFVRDSEDPSRPHLTQFWGGEAAYLDFTNPKTSEWWAGQVRIQLLGNGIAATWNDNNEFEIWDDDARADLAGRGGVMACLRPVQSFLMMRASHLAQIAHVPGKRPFLISRSGGPGMQRYVQTWTGDNRTDWKTLRYNLRMGHGLSLSGLFNFGHDVGGFAGPKPDPELFMRWIEQGIYWPRFTIHSANDDGSVTEPWMYPELLPQVRAALDWRERLMPFLYTLLWRAHAYHEPVLRPLFYNFPGAPEAYREEDCFLVGPDLLVAPILDQGAVRRRVWLPDIVGGWYDVRTGVQHFGGQSIEAEAPLGAAPAFIRAGATLPLGPSPSWCNGPLTLRLYPDPAVSGLVEIYDDDGESNVDPKAPPCLLYIEVRASEGGVELNIHRTGERLPRWPEIRFEDAFGRTVAVSVNSATPAIAISANAIPRKSA